MSGQEGAPKKKGFKLPHFKAAPGSEAELEQASKLLTSLGQRCAALVNDTVSQLLPPPPPPLRAAAGRQLPVGAFHLRRLISPSLATAAALSSAALILQELRHMHRNEDPVRDPAPTHVIRNGGPPPPCCCCSAAAQAGFGPTATAFVRTQHNAAAAARHPAFGEVVCG